MTYLLILLLVALAAAPLLHFAPSRLQRKQSRLREAAALGGLFVEFRDLPVPLWQRERLSASERQVLYYGLRLAPARGSSRAPQVWRRVEAGWEGAPQRTSPPGSIAELPACVLAAGVDDSSCGVYWREEGDEPEVAKICSVLGSWREQMTES